MRGNELKEKIDVTWPGAPWELPRADQDQGQDQDEQERGSDVSQTAFSHSTTNPNSLNLDLIRARLDSGSFAIHTSPSLQMQTAERPTIVDLDGSYASHHFTTPGRFTLRFGAPNPTHLALLNTKELSVELAAEWQPAGAYLPTGHKSLLSREWCGIDSSTDETKSEPASDQTQAQAQVINDDKQSDDISRVPDSTTGDYHSLYAEEVPKQSPAPRPTTEEVCDQIQVVDKALAHLNTETFSALEPSVKKSKDLLVKTRDRTICKRYASSLDSLLSTAHKQLRDSLRLLWSDSRGTTVSPEQQDGRLADQITQLVLRTYRQHVLWGMQMERTLSADDGEILEAEMRERVDIALQSGWVEVTSNGSEVHLSIATNDPEYDSVVCRTVAVVQPRSDGVGEVTLSGV